MFKYFPHTEDDLKEMMERVGVKNFDELYAQIPENIRFKGDYQIDSASTEEGVRHVFDMLGAQNKQLTCFAGYGARRTNN